MPHVKGFLSKLKPGGSPQPARRPDNVNPPDEVASLQANPPSLQASIEAPGGPRPAQVVAAGILCSAIVLGCYSWLISLGTWTQWPASTTYFDQLATSFQHGELALEAQPSPALLALRNPYEPKNRGDVPFLVDASLYHGKYYLYWGPVPGLVLAAAKTIYPHVLGDQYLVFAFTCGTFLVEALILYRLWASFFRKIAVGFVAVGLLLIGLSSPFGWLLMHPTVYEASIIAGQFFFLVGLYSAFSALQRASIGKWQLAISGISWMAAVGTRLTQIVPVGFMILLVLVAIIVKTRRGGNLAGGLVALLWFGLPLAMAAAGLAWYNWARFGSILETGISYQLAGLINLQKNRQDLFSRAYILQNLYNYLVHPPSVTSSFPYLQPTGGLSRSIFAFVHMPKIHYSQPVTGLLLSTPFVILAVVPGVRLLRRLQEPAVDQHAQASFEWLSIALWGSFLCGFATFLSFFWVAERYLADFVSSLLILSIIGLWQVGQARAPLGISRRLLIGVVCALAGFSCLAGILLALGSNTPAFREANPVLWQQLSGLFKP